MALIQIAEIIAYWFCGKLIGERFTYGKSGGVNLLYVIILGVLAPLLICVIGMIARAYLLASAFQDSRILSSQWGVVEWIGHSLTSGIIFGIPITCITACLRRRKRIKSQLEYPDTSKTPESDNAFEPHAQVCLVDSRSSSREVSEVQNEGLNAYQIGAEIKRSPKEAFNLLKEAGFGVLNFNCKVALREANEFIDKVSRDQNR